MQVKKLLETNPKKILITKKSTDVLKAMNLLIENKIGCLPVLDEKDKLIGIISDKDIFKAIYNNQDNFASFKVSDLMTTNLIVGVESDDINYIAGLMTNNRIRHIPIVEKDKLIGLISIGDVVKAQKKDMEIENRYLKLYIDGSYPA